MKMLTVCTENTRDNFLPPEVCGLETTAPPPKTPPPETAPSQTAPIETDSPKRFLLQRLLPHTDSSPTETAPSHRLLPYRDSSPTETAPSNRLLPYKDPSPTETVQFSLFLTNLNNDNLHSYFKVFHSRVNISRKKKKPG